MKRKPLPLVKDGSGKRFWQSLADHDGDPKVDALRATEFPGRAAELAADLDDESRRGFLKFMGASAALGGLAACRRPEEKILPYARQPEDIVHGRPLFFATAMPFLGTALGLVLESHDGRPIKVEGNPRHPDSLGSTNLYAQANILDLYDPDRSPSPLHLGEKRSWDEAAAALRAVGAKFKAGAGKGLAIVSDAPRSPTLANLLGELKRQMPEARVVRYEPVSRENQLAGAALAFGRPHQPVYDLAASRVTVSLDGDPLATEGSPVKQAKGFAKNRGAVDEGKAGLARSGRLYAVESGFTATGASADHRLRLRSSEIPTFAFALADELARSHGVDLGELAGAVEAAAKGLVALGPKAATWVRAIAKDLAQSRGASLLDVGRRQPPAVHAVAQVVNGALGNVGTTVSYVQTFDEDLGGAAALVELARAMERKEIDTLLVLGGNPVFDAPADARFEAAMRGVPTSIHLAAFVDETGRAATWHLNRAHPFEAWSDVRAEDGTATVIQPLIAPLHGGRTDAEVVDLLLGGGRKAYDLVRATWVRPAPAETAGQDGVLRPNPESVAAEKAWRRALHDGIFPNSAYPRVRPDVNAGAVAAAVRAHKPAAGGLEVTFAPDFHAWDGRFANNAWLQELPEPFSKVTWGNYAEISPATAKELGVVDGDVVRVTANGASVELPAVVGFGRADGSIGLTFGQGRREVGRVGKGFGVDVYPLRSSAAPGFAVGAAVEKTGKTFELARTQEHFHLEGRPIVREGTLAQFAKDPDFVDKMSTPHPELLSLWQEAAYRGHAWGMTIDLNKCVGCNTCVVACQAENNILVVGPEGVKRTREMHWLRIDRYFEGGIEDPRSYHQPMACVHCENAPCEQVCPVAATVHDGEGLNEMIYNRCVGTRYCANNCPWKVRRFNFFNYSKDIPETRRMQFNPDVTVRSRGVMEKCTYCVQRINEAKIVAKLAGRDRVLDGELTSACAQACPADAIVFGDLNDKNSRVSASASSPRAYKTLEELNTKPRTSFLARIRNVNPELENA